MSTREQHPSNNGYHRLEALAGASRQLAAEPDPAQALWHLVCTLRSDLGIDRAGIFSFCPITQSIDHVAGVGRNGRAEFSGRCYSAEGEPHPIKLVARRELPYFFSQDVQQEFPDIPWAPGVHAHAIVPIIAGDALVGLLAVDNCFTNREMTPNLLEPLFLYAGLAALPLFALYQKKERERVEAMRRHIHREVLFAVTNGKICLCDREQIDTEWPVEQGTLPINREYHVREVREEVRHVARNAGMDEDRAADLGLCASEAATNALLHGCGGSASVEGRDGVVRIRVSDHGRGISPDDLPRATLLKGWSSRASMGLGFTVINETADRLFLYTGPDGTTVIIEMAVEMKTDFLAGINPLLWEDDELLV
ncbi:MAG: ATP-binding region ATPase domain protein [Armatimonadetes bacterium]|nr:ATP-binding region ATPase domain protein [Armatimonadota bacterium]